MAYTSHGHVIPGLLHLDVPFEGQRHRCGGPGLCSVCTVEAMHAQKEAIADGASINLYPEVLYTEVTHNEETLTRVFGALIGIGMTGEEALKCVMALQNAGILFREVRNYGE